MFPNPSANAHIANCSRPGAFLSCVGYCQFYTADDRRAALYTGKYQGRGISRLKYTLNSGCQIPFVILFLNSM